MKFKINEIEITDVEYLTETECREVIGILATKSVAISSRETIILEDCEKRVREGLYDIPVDDIDSYEDHWSDAEADADTLASAGWGTDEDYGYFGMDEAY